MSVYNKKFYDDQVKGSLDSANEMIPILMNLINPKSVIDVGCGLGTWLSVFKDLGVNDILGLDGDWVDKNQLFIPKDNFITTDLENPVKIEKKFDLAISLEVGEHINKRNANKFIEYLSNKAPFILFSAAIPFQGGVNHINEQWPDYWIEIFKKNNFQVVDCIRNKIWTNGNVEMWYSQNTFLFVEKNYLKKTENLKNKLTNNVNPIYSIVHPSLFIYRLEHCKNIENNLKTDLLNEIKSQKQKFIKMETQETQITVLSNEVKNLLYELKNQEKNYQKKIEIIEKQKTDSFNEIKDLLYKLKNQKQVYEKKLKIKEEDLNKINSSNSWKMTKPLREIGKKMRSLKK